MGEALERLNGLDPSDSMEETLKAVDEVLTDIDPGSAEAGEMLCLIAKKEKKARDYYLRPFDSDDIYNRLIEVHRARGEEDMVDAYRRCLDLRQARKWMILGDSYQLMGINSTASTYLKRSLFFGPPEDLVEAVGSTLERAEKRVRKAEAGVDGLLVKVERDPLHKGNVFKALTCLIDLDRFDDALRLAESYLEKGGGDPDIVYKKGCAMFGKGRLDEALTIFEPLLETNPGSNNYKRAVNLCRDLDE